VSLIKVFADEDSMDADLIVALRARGVTATTAAEAGLGGKSDEEQLSFAAGHGFVLYTSNIADFYRLHTEWMAGEREHCGIILARQQAFSVGERLRRVLHIRSALSEEQMKNRVEFLGNWT
jgi:hypothetical protein